MNQQNRNRLTDTENRLMVARVGWGLKGWVKKYSIGNGVKNIAITTYGGYWKYWGEHFVNIGLPNHYAVHLQLKQNNIECKL